MENVAVQQQGILDKTFDFFSGAGQLYVDYTRAKSGQTNQESRVPAPQTILIPGTQTSVFDWKVIALIVLVALLAKRLL